MSVLILAGGLSHERDVSLRSGRRCADALRSAGHDVDVLDADSALLTRLSESSYSAALIALHGGAGEDGALRQVLELVALPYVGSTPDACRATWDKPTAKALALATGLATPRFVTLPHATFRELGAAAVLDRIVDHLGLPLMVKPARGGSALGCTAVDKADDLPAAMVQCFSYGEAALVEQLVVGTEVAVTVLDTGRGPRALPAVEVQPLSGVYDYTARYTLGLRDLSRVDLIVDGDGVPQLLEANVAPGMTETSLLPMAVECAGLELGTVLGQLLERAAIR